MSKLSDVLKRDVKKTVYDQLVSKVNNIDTNDFVLKTKYQTDKAELEKNLLMLLNSSLVKKSDHNTNISELEKKLTIIIMTNILQLHSLIL